MTTFRLEVQIEQNHLQLLRNRKFPYALCIAMQVGKDYNVVWKAIKNFTGIHRFEWTTEEYQIFASNNFKVRDDTLEIMIIEYLLGHQPGVHVKPQSNSQSIRAQQQCKFTESMQSATDDLDSPEDDSFGVDNQGQAISFGLCAELDGEFNTIYNTPGKVIKGAIFRFEPHNKVRVWFSSTHETSTMVGKIDGPYCDVEFSDKKTALKVSYKGGEPGNGNWFLEGSAQREFLAQQVSALELREAKVQGVEAPEFEAREVEVKEVEAKEVEAPAVEASEAPGVESPGDER
ncbi:hypothetical protein GYMLUDRAFT_239654 [Collybiopsis luxurians FD-317 M1]|nr:hypothetical protein GYMLUDRAFT_239654 [Collybiopsis luxurians FD-317 M1]